LKKLASMFGGEDIAKIVNETTFTYFTDKHEKDGSDEVVTLI